MLNIYRPPRSRSCNSCGTIEAERLKPPPGMPYLTKVNGKLVWAREKKSVSTTEIFTDLLGQAVGGVRERIVRRTRSAETETETAKMDIPKTPIVIGGTSYVPIGVVPERMAQSAPVPQAAAFPPMQAAPIPQAQPQAQFVMHPPGPIYAPQPQIVMHIPGSVYPPPLGFPGYQPFLGYQPAPIPQPQQSAPEQVNQKLHKHHCAQCGALRSNKFHYQHPLKAGEIPLIAFCAKCQRSASTTSCSNSDEEKGKHSKKKSKRRTKSRKKTRHSPGGSKVSFSSSTKSSNESLSMTNKSEYTPKPARSATVEDADSDFTEVEHTRTTIIHDDSGKKKEKSKRASSEVLSVSTTKNDQQATKMSSELSLKIPEIVVDEIKHRPSPPPLQNNVRYVAPKKDEKENRRYEQSADIPYRTVKKSDIIGEGERPSSSRRSSSRFPNAGMVRYKPSINLEGVRYVLDPRSIPGSDYSAVEPSTQPSRPPNRPQGSYERQSPEYKATLMREDSYGSTASSGRSHESRQRRRRERSYTRQEEPLQEIRSREQSRQGRSAGYGDTFADRFGGEVRRERQADEDTEQRRVRESQSWEEAVRKSDRRASFQGPRSRHNDGYESEYARGPEVVYEKVHEIPGGQWGARQSSVPPQTRGYEQRSQEARRGFENSNTAGDSRRSRKHSPEKYEEGYVDRATFDARHGADSFQGGKTEGYQYYREDWPPSQSRVSTQRSEEAGCTGSRASQRRGSFRYVRPETGMAAGEDKYDDEPQDYGIPAKAPTPSRIATPPLKSRFIDPEEDAKCGFAGSWASGFPGYQDDPVASKVSDSHSRKANESQRSRQDNFYDYPTSRKTSRESGRHQEPIYEDSEPSEDERETVHARKSKSKESQRSRQDYSYDGHSSRSAEPETSSSFFESSEKLRKPGDWKNQQPEEFRASQVFTSDSPVNEASKARASRSRSQDAPPPPRPSMPQQDSYFSQDRYPHSDKVYSELNPIYEENSERALVRTSHRSSNRNTHDEISIDTESESDTDSEDEWLREEQHQRAQQAKAYGYEEDVAYARARENNFNGWGGPIAESVTLSESNWRDDL